MIMGKLSMTAAVVFTISLAIVTGSLYVIGVRDDNRDQKELNQRLKKLCDQARNSKLSKDQRKDFLIKHCTKTTN